MAVSFNPLWKLLIDKKMKKKELARLAGVGEATIYRMVQGQNISTEVLEKICRVLDCNVQDILEFVDE